MMNPEIFNEIVDILTPLMGTEQSRQALVYSALLNEPVVKRIDFSGSTYEFVPQLVTKLGDYGKISTGELAVVVLLKAAKKEVGTDNQKRINRLIRELMQSSPRRQTHLPPTNSQRSFLEKLLSSPIWTGVGGIAAILALIVTFLTLPQLRGNEVTPTSTPNPTETMLQAIPSNAAQSVIMPTVQSTIAASRGFPCDGQIVFTTGALLNQVRVLPSTTSPARPPVQQGATVTITASQVNSAGNWYQMTYGSNTGWILDDYIELSSQCP